MHPPDRTIPTARNAPPLAHGAGASIATDEAPSPLTSFAAIRAPGAGHEGRAHANSPTACANSRPSATKYTRIGYVTPDDAHHGHGPHFRRGRRVALAHGVNAREQRLAHHRGTQPRLIARTATEPASPNAGAPAATSSIHQRAGVRAEWSQCGRAPAGPARISAEDPVRRSRIIGGRRASARCGLGWQPTKFPGVPTCGAPNHH